MEKEKLLRLEEIEKLISPKERRFIEELEVDGCKAEAALRAGYGKSRDGKENKRSAATAASRILAKEEVAEYRILRTMMLYEEQGFSAESIMTETAKVYRRCMQAEPVMIWDPEAKEWVESGEYRFDSKGALKALELLGENVGAFERAEKNDNQFNVNINVVDKIEKTE